MIDLLKLQREKIKLFWQTATTQQAKKSLSQIFHLDLPLLTSVLMLIVIGLFILYSASNQDLSVIEKQGFRIVLALLIMFLLAQIPPDKLRFWAPWIFGTAVVLLFPVLLLGAISHGAPRWLSLGLFKFQPSELMKLAMPMMLAWYFHDKHLPPDKKSLAIAVLLIIVPTCLIAKQPDLGTGLLIAASGGCVLILAGMSWRLIAGIFLTIVATMPLAWLFLHDYQRERVLTFLNPERDPLGSGYHIIQSKIAIGSGGVFGKGWLQGTQSHLQFLPEHATDFIFAVSGEELGLIGCIALITLYLIVVFRCCYIAVKAQDTFSRLLSGSLALTFFISMFINMGMVIGILPVVGLPLPLVSYGGTAIVTTLASFGILMSIHTHRKLLSG